MDFVLHVNFFQNLWIGSRICGN